MPSLVMMQISTESPVRMSRSPAGRGPDGVVGARQGRPVAARSPSGASNSVFVYQVPLAMKQTKRDRFFLFAVLFLMQRRPGSRA